MLDNKNKHPLSNMYKNISHMKMNNKILMQTTLYNTVICIPDKYVQSTLNQQTCPYHEIGKNFAHFVK